MQALAASVLGEAPASHWLGGSEAEQRWVTASEEVMEGKGGGERESCHWVSWCTTDNLASTYIRHTNFYALKSSWVNPTPQCAMVNI